MDELGGRIALVTGASRGIGRAIALALAKAGADVAINYLSRSEEAQSLAAELQRLGRRGEAIQADVSLAGDVTRLVETAVNRVGPVDIRVNTAGIPRPQAIVDIGEQDWADVIAVTLKSCFLVTQAVLPGMRHRRWGRVVNLSPVAAQVGGIVGPHYAASKAGMLGLTRYY